MYGRAGYLSGITKKYNGNVRDEVERERKRGKGKRLRRQGREGSTEITSILSSYG
jgi:hypothetical protein